MNPLPPEPILTTRLRRLNVYLFTVACVLGLLVLSYAALKIGRQLLRQPTGHNVAGATPDKVLNEKLSYRARSIDGDAVVLDVLSDLQLDAGFSSKSVVDTLRNQRFVNIATGAQTTLLADNAAVIVNVADVYGHGLRRSGGASITRPQDTPAPLLARLYTVVTRDTNGDGRLSARDDAALMLARPDGSQRVTWVEGVRGTYDNEISAAPGAPELRVLTTGTDGHSRLQRFDLTQWQALPAIELPPLAAR